MDELAVLAAAFREPISTVTLQIYASKLDDIEPSRLVVALDRACRELKFFPKIAELRNLAGVGANSSDEEIDGAWLWITRHVRRHGADEEAICHFTDPPEVTVRGNAQYRREIARRRESKAEEIMHAHPDMYWADARADALKYWIPVTVTPVPPIPKAIQHALRQLGFDLRGGLERIESADEKTVGFVRKEFAEAYRRGRAIERRETMALKFVAQPALGDGAKHEAEQTGAEIQARRA